MPFPQVEIRIITYKRPDLLTRAIQCLVAQTHPGWKAVVLDDSPLQEGREVVAAAADPRVRYEPNERNLGMVCNTSKAFAPGRYFEGSRYACVLEDDNLYDRDFLEQNLAVILSRPEPVLARNYRLMDVFEDGTTRDTGREPMKELYGEGARSISYADRITEAFFSFTLGNLSYFWDLDRQLDLSVSEEKLNGPVSEASRALSFTEDCWYEPRPLATFSRFVAKHQTPRKESKATVDEQRLGRLSRIRMTRRLLDTFSGPMQRREAELVEMAKRRGQYEAVVDAMAEAGSLTGLLRPRGLRRWINLVKVIPLVALYSKSDAGTTGPKQG